MGSESKVINFKLPAKGALRPNGPDDPLLLYYHPLVGYFYRKRVRQALSILTQQYDSILEIGYGSGILLPSLVSAGGVVSGIDQVSDPETVRIDLEKIGIAVCLKKGNIFAADYSSGSFDLIVAISIIEHIDDIAGLTKKVYALLRPGGHFLVGMPKVGGFMNVAFRIIGYKDMDSRHIVSYKRFLKTAEELFDLKCFTKIPSWAPSGLSLYFNMLFSKKR